MREGKIYKNTSERYQLENDTYYWTNDVDPMALYNGLEVRIED